MSTIDVGDRRRSSALIVDVSSVVDVSSIAGKLPALLETSTTLETTL
jgi:hypothetical protein